MRLSRPRLRFHRVPYHSRYQFPTPWQSWRQITSNHFMCILITQMWVIKDAEYLVLWIKNDSPYSYMFYDIQFQILTKNVSWIIHIKKKHPSTSRQEKHSNRTASLAILQRNNVCKRQKSQEVRAKLCQTPGMYGNFGGLKNCKPSHVWQPPLDPGLNRKDNFYEMRSKHVFTFVNLKKTVCKKKIKRPKAIWRWFWSPQYLSKLRQ